MFIYLLTVQVCDATKAALELKDREIKKRKKIIEPLIQKHNTSFKRNNDAIVAHNFNEVYIYV